MSDHIVRTSHYDDPKARESMHPYQSMWTAHWMRTSCESSPRVHNHLFVRDESKDDHLDAMESMLVQIDKSRTITRLDMNASPDNASENRNAWVRGQGLEIASDVSQSAKGGAMTGARRSEFMNQIPAVNSKNLRQQTSTVPSYPMFNTDRNRERTLASKKGFVHDRHAFKFQNDENSGCSTTAVGTSVHDFTPPRLLKLTSSEIAYPSRECCFEPEGTSLALELRVKPQKSFEKNFPVSRSFQHDLAGSTSNIFPFGFRSRESPVPSIVQRHDKTDQSRSGIASKEHITNTSFTHFRHECGNSCNHSMFLACEKKLDSQLNARKCGSSYFGQTDGALLLHDPSTSNYRFPSFVGEQNEKIKSFSGLELFPIKSSHLGVIKPDNLTHECHSLQKMPTCSDVNLSMGAYMTKESTVATNFKENAVSKLHSLPSNVILNGDLGAKLQPLGKSINNEGKDDVRDFKTWTLGLKNESLAETDTLDIDIFHEKNNLLGTASSLSNKDFIGGQIPAKFQATLTLPLEKVANKQVFAEIPDINQELPAFSNAAGLVNKRELSTSKTESLDVKHLISHAEQPVNSSSRPRQEDHLDPEPSSRWIKRLKLSSSDSLGHSNKSLKNGEASTTKKVNGLLGKIMNHRTSSEHMLGERLGIGQRDQTLAFLSNRQSSSMDYVKEGQDITFSRSWIQRLCHNRSASLQMKPAPVVVCKPQSSKVPLNELQKKQFPSIAAMALMGKAMSSFRPCEFRKRGSTVIWNTEGF